METQMTYLCGDSMEKEIEQSKNLFEIEFRIEGLPPIPGNGSHHNWRVAAGIRKVWVQKAFEALLQNKFKRPLVPLEKAKCTFLRVSASEPDDDNLRASFKPVRDALVRAGILVDDKPRNMPDPIYRWQKGKQKKGYVVVHVKEIETEKK